ncbi:T-cell surface glycoprotein CD3 zeta chain isoform X2 [Spea bombifrons]|uniref:T-cell surface glycoprotein CD3 zeta chain isoform X2 n=1 Tax=Spea bombifrons TaxID=233779 RepID=UPI00234AC8AA|nr:T-cell surface glycoprotein CD3 zeta chain isoform X2 [Spea bombifrons]
MRSKWIPLSALLLTKVPAADAQVTGLLDPRLCYILDGFLFLYAIIVTAMFFKEKLTKQVPETIQQDSTYSGIDYLKKDQPYDHLNKRRDPEKGERGQLNRKVQENSVYTGLQRDKLSEPYSGIHIKPEQRRKGKGNDAVYQGLSSATRDTYDALQMQTLHPR